MNGTWINEKHIISLMMNGSILVASSELQKSLIIQHILKNCKTWTSPRGSGNVSKVSHNAHGRKYQGEISFYGFQYFLISF